MYLHIIRLLLENLSSCAGHEKEFRLKALLNFSDAEAVCLWLTFNMLSTADVTFAFYIRSQLNTLAPLSAVLDLKK